MKKRKLFYMPIGIPSSGKTTWRKTLKSKIKDLCVVSPDEIRFKLLNSKETGIHYDPKIEPLVFKKVDEKIEECFGQNKDIFLDATNLIKKYRIPYEEESKKNGYDIIMKYFKIDPHLAIVRQNKRKRKVPKDIIFKMYATSELPDSQEYDIFIIEDMRANKKECNQIKDTIWIEKEGCLKKI